MYAVKHINNTLSFGAGIHKNNMGNFQGGGSRGGGGFRGGNGGGRPDFKKKSWGGNDRGGDRGEVTNVERDVKYHFDQLAKSQSTVVTVLVQNVKVETEEDDEILILVDQSENFQMTAHHHDQIFDHKQLRLQYQMMEL